MKDRLYKTASQVFGITSELLNEESSPDTIEQWDSLGHMNLIMALEEEFGILFSEDEVAKITNMGSILTALKNKKIA